MNYLSLSEIKQKFKSRKIIFFGAGDLSSKLTKHFMDESILIVDNASNLWGTTQQGLEVKAPSELNKFKKGDLLVIVCSTAYGEISEQLDSLGFTELENYVISPNLNNIKVISDLESLKKKILFTSGSPRNESKRFGGGLYELTLNKNEWEYKKVYSGHSYGLIRKDENILFTDSNDGIVILDSNYKVIKKIQLPKGIRAHGIDYSEKHDLYAVACSELDGIIILDRDFKQTNFLKISEKIDTLGEPQHHCNDCVIINDSIYLSMFSYTGNYKKDIFDGCVLEFDLNKFEKLNPVIEGLSMPHNIKYFEDGLHILNSLRGELLFNNNSVQGVFPAFTRGLDYDGMYYFVGQSRNRNYSKNIGVSKNISIDSGIIIFDNNTKVSRFLQLDPKLSEIHSILTI